MHPHERVGAWLTPDGCFFRVWGLAVLIQDGPYWEVDDTVVRQDLVKDGDYWSGTVRASGHGNFIGLRSSVPAEALCKAVTRLHGMSLALS